MKERSYFILKVSTNMDTVLCIRVDNIRDYTEFNK